MSTAREAIEESEIMLHTFAEPLAARIEAALADGSGSWGWDPDVDGVVGFSIEDPANPSRRKVVVIAYLEQDDFECDEEWAHGS